jgi:hypothetical protein
MNVGIVLAALGVIAAYVGILLTWHQARSQRRHARDNSHKQSLINVQGIPVRPPTGKLPGEVRGRDQLLSELHQCLRKPPGISIILTGTGGVGKSTIATAFAKQSKHARIGGRRPHVWWVAAGDRASLTGALVTVARQLGATQEDVEVIGAGRPDAPDQLWRLLDRVRRRWLLIFDNVDDVSVLASPMHTSDNVGSVADGTGWLRPTKGGLILVTSRNSSSTVWGQHSRVLRVGQLSEDDAAQVLLDWAPCAGDAAEARQLARRLGCLPLALQGAGSYLGSDIALWASFRDYRLEFDNCNVRPYLLTSEPSISSQAGTRASIMHTWELSLDALTRAGVAQARPLLRLLSCYAASIPIPRALLSPRRLACLLAHAHGEGMVLADRDAEHRLEHGLHQLTLRSLIEVRDIQPFGVAGGNERAVVVHPVIADVNRAHLLDEKTKDANAAMVRHTAIGIVADAVDRLDVNRATDWPHFQILGNHLHALFDTVARRVDGVDLCNLLTTTIVVARAHNSCGALPAAERLLRKVLDMVDLLDERDSSNLSTSARQELAWDIAIQGKLAESETMYRDVYAVRRQILGEEHPDTLYTRHELAWVTASQQRWAEAEAAYRKVLTARQRVLGEEDPHTLTTHHELAWVIANQDREKEAEPILLKVADVRRRVLGKADPDTLKTRNELAWIAASQERWAEAEAMYREVLAARRRVLGEAHHHTLTTRLELAWTMAAQGNRVVAITEYQEVLDAYRRFFGEDHPGTVQCRELLRQLHNDVLTRPRHLA